MIVAFDVSHIQKRRSGIGQYALALLRDLLRSHPPMRFVLHGWSASLDMEVLRSLASDSVALRSARIPGHVKRFTWDRLRMPAITAWTGPFDLFHSMDPFAPPTGSRPTIVTVHDLLSRSHPGYFTSAMRRRDAGIALPVGRAAGIVVPTEYTRGALIEARMADPSRIEVAAPSIPEWFAPASDQGDAGFLESAGLRKPYLLFVGTIEPRKNLAALVKAFEILCDREREADLVIAGKLGWMSEQIVQQMKTSRHALRIRRPGYLSDRALASLYRNAICVVYPSFAEGYGRPVAEAMASGVPVITSNSTGMAEIAGDGAALIDPYSLEQLVETLDGVMTSEAVHESLKARGLKRAAELNKRDGVGVVLRLYQRLASR